MGRQRKPATVLSDEETMRLILAAVFQCKQRLDPIALMKLFRHETGRWPAYRLLPRRLFKGESR